MTDTTQLLRILDIMKALRDPESGCPWDIEQNFASIAPYTIEEAYEVADAIETGNMETLKDELGDLLLQVVFHAQMADEAGYFNFFDVAATISDKMERRHPHVFGDTDAANADAVKSNWEDIKARERAEKSAGQQASLLDDVPTALPGLSRAVKLQRRAARVGFDWNEIKAVFAKLDEEIDELRHEIRTDIDNKTRLEDELGDVLFVIANLARHLGVDPEAAIRSTNAKFTSRFKWMEKNAELDTLSLAEMEHKWQQAKAHIR
jgi:ATP diphosphatase